MADADSNTASSGTLVGSPQQVQPPSASAPAQSQPDSNITETQTQPTADNSSGQQTQSQPEPASGQEQDPSNQNSSIVADSTFDASIEADMNQLPPTDLAPPSAGSAEAMNLDGAAPQLPPTADPSQALEQQQIQAASSDQQQQQALYTSPRLPIKKDTSLRHFLSKMDSTYTPLIPDAVTSYYLSLAGLPPPPETPLPLARLLALATQKFIADIAADAYQYSRIRSTNTTSNNPLTGLGGAAGFGAGLGGGPGGGGDEGGAQGKKSKESAKAAPIGGPRPGFGGGGAGGTGGGAGGAAGQARTVLTMEDLGMAVGEYGVNVRRGEFYR
ncbi:hypothetical protein K431DRAFT_287089 [Polychaeton citri CBS 116435]|uniref:Transcription initiation factor TFIID subunit 10 n=1 Tax=Polychaeton citri CBS 116435 TaxID=1314669 RepID=A0A9P4Q3F3_9PEZI|nr:hypothetical protein K431DRAFT_287089 [Polychaeton citri CBS 116435]